MASRAQRKAAAEHAERLLENECPDPDAEAQRIRDTICERLGNGESLRAICNDETLPSTTTVKRWLNEDEAFRAQYVRAREDQAEHYADVIVEISDTEPDPAKARVRIDARKWVAAKLLPKKYGDRTTTELTGADGRDLNLSDHESAAKIAAILEAVRARSRG